MAANSLPMLSIITVTKNDLAGLRRTHASIALQRNRDFEWVVIDGASADDTVGFLQGIGGDARPRWISEPDAGLYDAMNKGIRNSLGTSAIFLNAGDTFFDEYSTERIGDARIRVGDKPMIAFAAEVVDDELRRRRRRPGNASYLRHSMPCVHQALVYPLNALCSGYRSDLRCCGDYDLTARLWSRGIDYVRVNQPLVTFRLGGYSSANPDVLVREAALVQREVLGLHPAWIFASRAVRRATMSAMRHRLSAALARVQS